VKAWVESVSLEGSALRIAAPDPLPAARDTLAVASAIRALERFPALDAVILAGGGADVRVTRAEAEAFLAPDGFAALRDRGRWPQVLSRALQRRAASFPDGAA
jgi:hypothetical protein